MKILVTGATGFIGNHLINKLLENNHTILGLSRTIKSKNNKLNFQNIDLANPESYTEIISDFKPEIIIQLAWQDIPNFSFEKSLLNLKNSVQFLSFILRIHSVKKVIISGSCFEYLNPSKECIEGINENPKDYFTWAKLSLKSFIELEQLKCSSQIYWFRIFYVFGPNQRSGSLIPTIINSFKKKELPNIINPFNANDFIYVDDVIDSFLSVINQDVPSGTYNIGSGSSKSVLEICSLLESLMCNTNSMTLQIKNLKINEIKTIDFWANIEKAKKILKWEPRVSLKEGLQKMLIIND